MYKYIRYAWLVNFALTVTAFDLLFINAKTNLSLAIGVLIITIGWAIIRFTHKKFLMNLFYGKLKVFSTIVQGVSIDASYGTDKAWNKRNYQVFTSMRTPVEKIIASAIKSNDGLIFAVHKPGRHHHVVWAMGEFYDEDSVSKRCNNQGFITSESRYVSREDAYQIALNAGQIIKKTGNLYDKMLYSEDIWDETLLPIGVPIPKGMILVDVPKFLLKDSQQNQ